MAGARFGSPPCAPPRGREAERAQVLGMTLAPFRRGLLFASSLTWPSDDHAQAGRPGVLGQFHRVDPRRGRRGARPTRRTKKSPGGKKAGVQFLTKRERGHTAHVCHGTSSRATTGHAAALPNVWTTSPPHPRSPVLIGGGMGQRPHPWPAVQGPVPAHLHTDIARRHREVPVVRMIRGIGCLRPQACASLFQCSMSSRPSPIASGRWTASGQCGPSRAECNVSDRLLGLSPVHSRQLLRECSRPSHVPHGKGPQFLLPRRPHLRAGERPLTQDLAHKMANFAWRSAGDRSR